MKKIITTFFILLCTLTLSRSYCSEGENYSVNGIYYLTLAEAYSGSDTSEMVIKVERDNIDDSNFVIQSGKKVVIDTNNHVITKIVNPIVNKGKLTINGNGTIKTDVASRNELKYLIRNYEALDVGKCTINNQGLIEQQWVAIYSDNGVVNIDGANIICDFNGEGSSTKTPRVICIKGNTIFNLLSGKIETNVGQSERVIEAMGALTGEINISGGKIIAGCGDGIVVNGEGNSLNVNISRGDITAYKRCVFFYEEALGNLTIENGNLLSNNNSAVVFNGSGKTIIGNQNKKLSEKPEICGKTYAIEAPNGFYFYNGLLLGKKDCYNGGDIRKLRKGYELKLGTLEKNSNQYHSAVLIDSSDENGTSEGNDSTEELKDEVKSIVFKDTNLAQAIIKQLKCNYKKDGSSNILLSAHDIESVTELHLNDCGIKSLSGIEAFDNLQSLDLSNNFLSNIKELSLLTNLVQLHLRGNSIDSLSSISNLKKLEYLDVSQNQLNDTSTKGGITNDIKDLTNLAYLDLSHNYVIYTNGLSNLKNLKNLNLYNNAIIDMSGLDSLTNLEVLNLGYNNVDDSNNISGLDVLNSLRNLEQLDFSDNCTKEIVHSITGLKHLKKIDLQNNKISEIDALINQLTDLEYINLYKNDITDISQLYTLYNLKELNIEKNRISSINGIVKNGNMIWGKLKKLNISFNDIDRNDNIETINFLNNNLLEFNYEYNTDTSKLPHFNAGTPYVTYEDFGAKCDGVYDDYIAIRNAHLFANDYVDENGNHFTCEVRATKGKKYHIFNYFSDAVEINTNVDWNNCTFIIHDEVIDYCSGRFKSLFNVSNVVDSITKNNVNLAVDENTKNIYQYISNDLEELNKKGYEKYFCVIYNKDKKQFARTGRESQGNAQQDVFVMDSKGNVLNDFMWNFDKITKIIIYPIPNDKMIIKNATFITNNINSKSEAPNSISGARGTVYYKRGIYINKLANADISKIKHELQDDSVLSGSYHGFLDINDSACISVSDCSLVTRRYLGTSTYDLYINTLVSSNFKNIDSNNVYNNNCWGVTGTNYTKDLTFENCKLNRIDAHRGMFNLTVKNCEIGCKGLTLTGKGTANIVDTKVFSDDFITLRSDYGSTWDGHINIINCSFVLEGKNDPSLVKFSLPYGTTQGENGKNYYFGYDNKFPNLYVENIKIDNSKYSGSFSIIKDSGNSLKLVPESYWPEKIEINGYDLIKSNSKFSIDLLKTNYKFSLEQYDNKKDIDEDVMLKYDNVESLINVKIKKNNLSGTYPSSGAQNGNYNYSETNTSGTEDNTNNKTENSDDIVESNFVDIKVDDWFYDYVRFVVKEKLFNGVSVEEFAPQMSMTRGMLVTVLYRYSKKTENEFSIFKDVDKNSYYSIPIQWATKRNIVNGIGDGKFAPDTPISRQDLATIIVRYLKQVKDTSSFDNSEYVQYDDDDLISDYAKENVKLLRQIGLMTGKQFNIFDPRGETTRAEVAAIMARLAGEI